MLKFLQRSKLRDVHARCALRKHKGPHYDPSPAEILEWQQNHHASQGPRSMVLGPRAIHDAFDSGAEVCSLSILYQFGIVRLN